MRASRRKPTVGNLEVAALPLASHLATVRSRLEAGKQNVVISVLGDSTGVTIIGSQVRWPYLMAQILGTLYPAYTVLYYNWNDTGQTYDAAMTLSTGTGGVTLSVYNGSTSGALATYSVSRLALQLPVTPNALILNYGHNSAGTTARGDNYGLIRAVRESFPFCEVLLTAQNPQGVGGPSYVSDLARQQTVIDLAKTEGFGLVNVFQAFLENPNYTTEWLLSDQLHPSAAGSARWTAEVMKHFHRSSAMYPAVVPNDSGSIFIPAASFVLKSGSPTLVVTNDQGPVWSFPIGATSVICGHVDIPQNWDQTHFYGIWIQSTGSGFTVANNVCVMRLRYKGLGARAQTYGATGGTANNTVAAAATSALAVTAGTVNSGYTFAANNVTVGVKKTSYFGYINMISFGIGHPLSLEVARIIGGTPTDNYGDPMLLLGIQAVRQS